jgi:glucosamine-6-phosphate deaminase
MEVVPLGSADGIAAVSAGIVEAVVRRKPAAVLGLATGSTPLPTYRELIRRHDAAVGPSYGAVTCFNLDEYVGLPAGHPQSYRATIARELTDGLGIRPDRVNGPDPCSAGLPTAGERYEALILAAGGVDGNCSASAPTATWPSTSPDLRWPAAPGSRPSPRRRARTTRASSARSMRCQLTC